LEKADAKKKAEEEAAAKKKVDEEAAAAAFKKKDDEATVVEETKADSGVKEMDKTVEEIDDKQMNEKVVANSVEEKLEETGEGKKVEETIHKQKVDGNAKASKTKSGVNKGRKSLPAAIYHSILYQNALLTASPKVKKTMPSETKQGENLMQNSPGRVTRRKLRQMINENNSTPGNC